MQILAVQDEDYVGRPGSKMEPYNSLLSTLSCDSIDVKGCDQHIVSKRRIEVYIMDVRSIVNYNNENHKHSVYSAPETHLHIILTCVCQICCTPSIMCFLSHTLHSSIVSGS